MVSFFLYSFIYVLLLSIFLLITLRIFIRDKNEHTRIVIQRNAPILTKLASTPKVEEKTLFGSKTHSELIYFCDDFFQFSFVGIFYR